MPSSPLDPPLYPPPMTRLSELRERGEMEGGREGERGRSGGREGGREGGRGGREGGEGGREEGGREGVCVTLSRVVFQYTVHVRI